MIRPERVGLARAGNGAGIAGKVVSRTFLGEKTEYHVAIGDQLIQASLFGQNRGDAFSRRSGAGAVPGGTESRDCRIRKLLQRHWCLGAALIAVAGLGLGINLVAAQGDGKGGGAARCRRGVRCRRRGGGLGGAQTADRRQVDRRRWLRVVNTGRKFSHVAIDGVDPFSKKRERVEKGVALGAEARIESDRDSFADFTSREIHFYRSEADWRADKPAVTVYYLGVCPIQRRIRQPRRDGPLPEHGETGVAPPDRTEEVIARGAGDQDQSRRGRIPSRSSGLPIS